MAGLLVVADRFGQPIALSSSAPAPASTCCSTATATISAACAAGDPGSPLLLAPEWTGPPPPAAAVRIAAAPGVDLNPLDVRRDRDRLLAYVWPDQARAAGPLEAALAIAAADPPPVDAGDAADWIEARLGAGARAGRDPGRAPLGRLPIFPAGGAGADRRAISRRPAPAATRGAPLAWLRFEKLPDGRQLQPAAADLARRRGQLLAWAHPHGSRSAGCDR